MSEEIEGERAEIMCVEDIKTPGAFALMNLQTREVWPISQAGMIALTNSMQRWFMELNQRVESREQ